MDTVAVDKFYGSPRGHVAKAIAEKEDFDELNATKLERLRTEIAVGVVAVERGEYKDYDKEGLVQLGERVKAEGRRIRVAT